MKKCVNAGGGILLGIILLLGLPADLVGSELGHYNPGLPNIRDLFLPDPGFYYIQYNLYYTSDTYKDRRGRSLSSLPAGPGSVDIDFDLDIFMVVPMLVWISPGEILGARYGAYVAPSFGNSSFGAALETEIGWGRSINESQFAAGDLYLQPLWLGWPLDHWDFAFGYGLYFPVGKYEKGAADNVGLGFWSHQFQAAAACYPWKNRATALTLAVTYDLNSEKEDSDITPGSHLSLNWGISQYLPLSGEELLLEVGLLGYDQWKVAADRGDDLVLEPAYDRVHAVGIQCGVTYTPIPGYLNFKYLYEYDAKARFEGEVLNLSFLAKF